MKQAQQKMGRHKKGRRHPCDAANAQVKHDTAQADRKARKAIPSTKDSMSPDALAVIKADLDARQDGGS